MSPALVALLLAAPVVKLGAGSGVVIDHGLLVTTHQVMFATSRPEAKLEDGGTLQLVRTIADDPEHDIALVVIEPGAERAVLAKAVPDAGTVLTVLTGTETYEAVVGAQHFGGFDLTIADAGVVAGAALVDAQGVVWGMVRDEKRAIASEVLNEVADAFRNPPEKRDFARWRNLGISAAFFLGLSVWWVYRSRARRY